MTEIDRYRVKDYRIRCYDCGRWMRWKPTAKTPAKRAPVPRVARCVDCALAHALKGTP